MGYCHAAKLIANIYFLLWNRFLGSPHFLGLEQMKVSAYLVLSRVRLALHLMLG